MSIFTDIIHLFTRKLTKEENNMTEKTVNYTDEMVARILEVYDPEAGPAERDAQV